MKKSLLIGLILALFACEVHQITAAEGFFLMTPQSYRTRSFFMSNTTPFPLRIEYKEHDPKIKSSLWSTHKSWRVPKDFEKTIEPKKDKDLFFKVRKGGGIQRGQVYTIDFNCVLEMDPQYSFTLRFQTMGDFIGSKFTVTFISPTGEKQTLLASHDQKMVNSSVAISLDNNTRLVIHAHQLTRALVEHQVFSEYLISLSLKKLVPIKQPTHQWANQ